MESRDDNHYKHVFEVFTSRQILFHVTLIYHRVFKTTPNHVDVILGGRLIMLIVVKTKENPHGDQKSAT